MRFWLSFLSFGLCLFESCNEIEDCTLDPYANYAVATFNVLNNVNQIVMFDSIIFRRIWSIARRPRYHLSYASPLPVKDKEAIFIIIRIVPFIH